MAVRLPSLSYSSCSHRPRADRASAPDGEQTRSNTCPAGTPKLVSNSQTASLSTAICSISPAASFGPSRLSPQADTQEYGHAGGRGYLAQQSVTFLNHPRQGGVAD